MFIFPFTQIHSFVLSAILSRDPSFKVYYTKNAKQDAYLAILGIKNETMFDAKQQLHVNQKRQFQN